MATSMAAITVLIRSYHVHADAYLLVGRMDDSRLAPYCVAWQPRNPLHAGAAYDEEFFTDEMSAQARITQIVARGDMPEDGVFADDWQQYPLYAWEDECLKSDDRPISKMEAARLLAQIARDTDTRKPRLIWEEETHYSDYDDCDHTIRFGHRDRLTLIHEAAHAVYEELHTEGTGANHSPGFVWILIDLYHRYGGFDLDFLMNTAEARGLTGDLSEHQATSDMALPAPAAKTCGRTEQRASAVTSPSPA